MDLERLGRDAAWLKRAEDYLDRNGYARARNKKDEIVDVGHELARHKVFVLRDMPVVHVPYGGGTGQWLVSLVKELARRQNTTVEQVVSEMETGRA